MADPLTAAEILDREFLEMRAKILELAASLDRLNRGAGSVAADARLQQIHEALGILREHPAGRAERVQMLFSLPYLETWRRQFELDTVR